MIRFILVFFFVFSIARAQDLSGLSADFKELISKSGISLISNNAFCVDTGNGAKGVNVNKLMRIASVTKLFTTLHASETLDLHKTYSTYFKISADHLHIEGSGDPYFEEEKMILLLYNLNQLGYKSFKKVTFNADFKFYDLGMEKHEIITPEKTLARLSLYFNRNSKNLIQEKLNVTKKFAEEEGIFIDDSILPIVHANSIELVRKNPFRKKLNTTYVHVSRPLHRLIKAMNVMSKNYVSQNIYEEASKKIKLASILTKYGINQKTFIIHNGSGLPIKGVDSRKDNWASCKTVLEVIKLIKKSITKHNLTLSDVVAVNDGQDLGTFRSRFSLFPETRGAILAKTGTLMHTSTLAGIASMEDNVPFAILNHTSKIPKARDMQDEFSSRIFHHLGIPSLIDYFKIPTFPWEGKDFMTSID